MAIIEAVVDAGFTRSSSNAEEVAIAEEIMEVGETSLRSVDVDVGSKPGGGSISCVVRRQSIFLNVDGIQRDGSGM